MENNPLCLTLGDPNGIGPELVCRLFGEESPDLSKNSLIILGPEKALEYYCRLWDIPFFWEKIRDPAQIPQTAPGIYCYLSESISNLVLTPGEASRAGGRAAGESLQEACDLIKKGMVSGLITCPLNKDTLVEAGYNFSGHTEFLAENFGLAPRDVCMHLAGERLRVSLATRHCSLRQVPKILNTEGIEKSLELTWDLVQNLGVAEKPIGVCGLNPHAGESGEIGDEEENIISPAIKSVLDSGIYVQGPLPADTIFHRAFQGEFSAVLAMYHDQGLAPLKLLHFKDAVNITLGLPFVRTSVDHGTGYDLVGKKRADYSSLNRALNMAQRLSP